MRPSSALKPITPAPSTVTAGPKGIAPGQVGAAVVLGFLKAYKVLLSPLFTGSCRFHPSCSDYMAEAVRVHGASRGVWLGLKRLSRCRPLGGYGVDPVPPA